MSDESSRRPSSTMSRWVTGCNAKQDDKKITDMLQTGVAHILSTQDGPMAEAEQAAMADETDFLAHKPLILKADAAGIRARRILRKLIREEQQGGVSAPLVEAAE